VQKWWSVFFGVVLAATFGIWLVAPAAGWWLPPNVASYGGEVDFLFYLILGMTGFFFVLTEVILVWCMWRYAYEPGRKVLYTHGNHKLEMLWTAVPAALLLFIAFSQVRAWERVKYQSRMPPPDMTVQVTARQWEWRIRHPYETSRFNYTADTDPTQAQIMQRAARQWADAAEYDDIQLVNELHTWQGANVKIYLKTLDILHSFYLPNLRLKQDALPGKVIPMWFRATAANTVRAGPTEWLGNKDPQKWPEDQKRVRLLNAEALKREAHKKAEEEVKAKEVAAAKAVKEAPAKAKLAKSKEKLAKAKASAAETKKAAGEKKVEQAKAKLAEADKLEGKKDKPDEATTKKIEALRAEGQKLQEEGEKLIAAAEALEAEGEKLAKEAKALRGEARARAEDVKKARQAATALQAEVDKLEAQRKAQPGLARLDATPDALRGEAARITERSDPGFSWEIACAELCGARHAYMKGRLYVHPTREDFEAWLAHAYRQQRARK
jgi:cytochrome c oxidase subunit 2